MQRQGTADRYHHRHKMQAKMTAAQSELIWEI
jgi:hypothetical protein